MSAFSNVLNYVVQISGVTATITSRKDKTVMTLEAAPYNYFRNSAVDENITSSGRAFVISSTDLAFIPRRSDKFELGPEDYYVIDRVEPRIALGKTIGYKLVLK